jgi:hypothetical protein
VLNEGEVETEIATETKTVVVVRNVNVTTELVLVCSYLVVEMICTCRAHVYTL